MNNNSRLVYSTAGGRGCLKCGKTLAKCSCTQASQAPAKTDGVIRISRETKGRKGKGVTVVTGLKLNSEELQKLARRLKTLCGSGGTVKQSVIEIQGDHRQVVKQFLEDNQEQKVVLAGG